MFNKTYQSRAVRQSGGGHKLAIDALLRLPEDWRPLVTIAAAAEGAFYRPKRRPLSKRPRRLDRSSQLELPFQEKPPARDPQRPLFDIFPDAYD
jgi:hypothetical protein